MKRFNRNLVPLFGALVISIAVFTACEDGGVVGSSFLPPNPTLRVDTITTLTIGTEPLVSYAGAKAFIAAGRYQDQLFGTYEAVGLITPTLIQTTDTLTEDTQFGFVLRPTQTFGDTMSTSVFDVYEIQQRWRAQEWRMDDAPVLAPTPLARFEIGLTDSVFVPLPDSWGAKYRSFYDIEIGVRDSAYVQSEFGFALVPVSGNKISYINASESFLMAVRPDTSNLMSGLRQRASNYRIISPSNAIPDNGVVIMNDFTRTGTVSFDISEEIIGAKIVSRAELVFYEDRQLQRTSLGNGHIRFSNNVLRLFRLTDDEKEYYVTKDASTSAALNDTDGSYRINITPLVNNAISTGERQTFTYYIVTDLDNGIISPKLIMNNNSGLRSPRIIITRSDVNR